MLDFTKTFKKYENLVAEVEKGVGQIKAAFPEEVRCNRQCCDCCFAVFDLTLIEAVSINYRFFRQVEQKEQAEILERANAADRQGYRLKRKLHKLMAQEGQGEEAVLRILAQERIQCPLLNESRLCDLYEFRPITCRVYGVPTAFHGKGHTCGLSGFQEGMAYPTINLDSINRRLLDLSVEMLQEVGIKNSPLEQRLVPLSTALLTDYDEEYFGF
ncbi:MAG: YkgJ family cysteine cluster protein [Thermodesulfobacteriota bacterium]